MKNYTSTIQFGSTGDDVKKWQEYLNTYGADLAVDGIFGEETKRWTKDIQRSNGLAVDGIVGKETWGLAGFSPASTSTGTSTGTSTNGWSYDKFSYDPYAELSKDGYNFNTPYTESGSVKDAKDALNTHLATKPKEYQSQWKGQLDELMKQIMGREKFSYNFNEDALYQQYKDKYVQQGKMAMGDAIGQASAMTGGYGNSYAQSVGQQAYQNSLDNLNDIVPELYQMALDKYNMEGQDLLNQYGLVMDREDMDYGRYRDSLSDFYTERDYLQGRYDSERDFDYSKYVDDRNFSYDQYVADRNFDYTKYSSDRNLAYDEYATDKNLGYQQYRDAIEDDQWQKEYDESVRQYNETMAFNKDQANKTSVGNNPGGLVDTNNNGVVDENDQVQTAAIPDEVKQKSSTFKSNTDLNNYLAGLENSGVITPEQSDALFAQYKQPDNVSLSERDWKLDGDGGTNWFWGIDNNATVKDQYGNIYRLDKLVDALVAEGMDKSAAKDYVKKLQKKLGA